MNTPPSRESNRIAIDHYLATPQQINRINLDAVELGLLDHWSQVKVAKHLSRVRLG
jgi:hypothetical protein